MPASIIKTDAITLRIAPFSNTSHVVTWITPQHGKVATVAKGALRPKSPVLGQYDVGYLCELLFYARSRNGLHIIRECCALNNRHDCRGDWRATAALSHLCHLAEIATPDGVHAPGLYNLLQNSLNEIERDTLDDSRQSAKDGQPGAKLINTMLQFEMQLLKLLGIAPQLDRCTDCNRPLGSVNHTLYFSAENGGMVCRDCHKGGLLPVAPLTLATLQRWQAARPTGIIPAPPDIVVREITPLLGRFLTHHMDLSPASRAVAYQTATIPNSGNRDPAS